MRYHPAFQRLQIDGLRPGRWDGLQYIYSNRLNLGRVRREENILWSFAPHDISMILALTGEDPVSRSRRPAPVTCTARSPMSRRRTSRSPAVSARTSFVSWLHPFKEQKLVVVGDGGMAVLDDGEAWERKLVLYAA